MPSCNRPMSFVLKVYVRDIKAYEQLMEKISRIPVVKTFKP